ncbi:hypothetical protein pdam_00015886 [Pocillopora damicornis]|uniref:TIR domain-containing protein n=1 Tax=Pocillopora damicornis TaxID=46731 RepID=A0A3M6URM2_POCDA|nr:hypothetical protein pdam_00015886 [Pocillopora damicornis]
MYKSVFNGVIAIVFIWSNVAILCVLCPSPSGIHDESKLAGQMKLCRRRCGLRFQADDAESTSNEGLRERRQSSYEECLSFVRKRCLRSRLNKQKQSLDQRTKRLFKREKRDAPKCFKPKGKNDTIYSPESISLTLKNWKSSGGYEGEVSWKPFKGLRSKLFQGLGHFLGCNVKLAQPAELRFFDFLPDDALNWTGYTVIYNINNNVTKCRDFGKNFTSYKIPLKLQSGWVVTALVTLLPFPTGYKFSIPYCFVSDEKNCKKGNKNTIIIIIGVVLAIAFLAGVIATLRYCRRSKTDLTPSMPDLKFEYDAFVIFSSQDSDWVVNTLIPTLEKKHGLKCCIHYRNFTPGVLFRDNVVDSVYKCRKTLAIVSTHFFDSNYCGSELDFALHRLMEKRDDSLVVIKLDEVDKRKLPIELQERSYIDYSKSVEKEAWEKKLVDCLKNKAKK